MGKFRVCAGKMQIVRSPSEDYTLGYRHGSDSESPKTHNVWNREAYFGGYIAGMQARNERMAGGKGHVVIPEWMTPAQVEAVNKLYYRNPDGSKDRYEFFTRVENCGIGSNRYAGITWCGLFVGIDPDGHTHT